MARGEPGQASPSSQHCQPLLGRRCPYHSKWDRASSDLAHIVYCATDRAEFIRRRPNPIGPTGEPTTLVTDYSAVELVAAHHVLLSVGG